MSGVHVTFDRVEQFRVPKQKKKKKQQPGHAAKGALWTCTTRVTLVSSYRTLEQGLEESFLSAFQTSNSTYSIGQGLSFTVLKLVKHGVAIVWKIN